jgi:hypothetical protein
MSNGSHLSPDFVGYDVGVPHVEPPALVGFVGFLDFTGIPVGVGEAPIPPEPTPLPSFAGGGISYGEFRRRKRKKGDEEIIFL